MRLVTATSIMNTSRFIHPGFPRSPVFSALLRLPPGLTLSCRNLAISDGRLPREGQRGAGNGCVSSLFCGTRAAANNIQHVRRLPLLHMHCGCFNIPVFRCVDGGRQRRGKGGVMATDSSSSTWIGLPRYSPCLHTHSFKVHAGAECAQP